MAGDGSTSILRRMTAGKSSGPEDVPITSSRAVRMAMRRAADKAHGLVISVLGLQEETIAVDGLSDAVDEAHLLVGITRGEALSGLCAIDLQLRAAIIEMQTMGRLQANDADPRPATATDAMMMTDLLAMFLKMLGETTARTDLDSWSDGAQVGRQVASLRAAGLVLADVEYRLIRLSLEFGGDGRKGELTLILPVGEATVAEVILPDVGPNWQKAFQKSVSEAPATLHARLHKFSLPLHEAECIAVGQIIPLPGCTVDSVKLYDPNGRFVTAARLGQFAGKRAVRMEPTQVLNMTETGVPAAPIDASSVPQERPVG
jgi:flagellar motor switch protein FliM